MFKQFFPAMAWAMVILGLSLVPGRNLPKVGWDFFTHLDKVAHMVVYFILVIVIGWCHDRRKRLGLRKVLVILAVSAMYGVALEVMQYSFLSDRFFEIHDIIANIIGSTLGAVVIFLMFNKMKRL